MYENIRKIDNQLLIEQKVAVDDIKPKEKVAELAKEIDNLENANLENCLASNFIQEYMKTANDPILNREFQLVLLPEQHEEWSQFRFPEAMQVKLGFECMPGCEDLVYELEYKEKRDSQNVVKKDLKGKLDEIDWE